MISTCGWRDCCRGRRSCAPMPISCGRPIIVRGDTGPRATDAITATRTDTPLPDISQTVGVGGCEEIEQRQVTSLTAALESVPSLTEQSTSANRGESYLLRGFEADAYAIDGTVANAASNRPETDYAQSLACISEW